ncbi:hypothetical protein BKI52_22480 [marine bacterium AO1-C]|nr:hypothetical protein BKI52_22480 [marine bacterium AO1-C]
MNRKTYIPIIGCLILVSMIIYFFTQPSGSENSLDNCGYMLSCPGKTIQVKLDTMKVDQYVDIPTGGKFALCNIKDTLSPKIIKIDKGSNVIWAVDLSKKSCWIPHNKLTDVKLIDKTLAFFNESYSEPGSIYLDKNYDIKLICLSPM